MIGRAAGATLVLISTGRQNQNRSYTFQATHLEDKLKHKKRTKQRHFPSKASLTDRHNSKEGIAWDHYVTTDRADQIASSNLEKNTPQTFD
jgi:hypothetical protein